MDSTQTDCVCSFWKKKKKEKAKKFKSYSPSSQKQNPVTEGLWEVNTSLQEMDNLKQALLNKSLSHRLLSITQ